MKKYALFFALLISAITLKAQAPADIKATLTKIGQQVPAFEFYIDKDKTVNIESYKGKIVMLNFFATWCGPCMYELPLVQKEIWEKYKDNPKFALFVFGREQGWDKVLPFKESNNYTFPILPDKGRKIFSLFATQAIPRNVVLDENGKIIYQSIGYSDKSFAELLKVLDTHINKLLP